MSQAGKKLKPPAIFLELNLDRVVNTTEVKVLFDDKHLYFGVFARDSVGKKGIRVQDLRRDFSRGENDIFGIQLDPQNLKQYGVSFQTTP